MNISKTLTALFLSAVIMGVYFTFTTILPANASDGAAFKCPLTVGFWKNHPDAWPVTSLTLGSQTYTEAQLLIILNTPSSGDASLILAKQLIAAKLNIANGADPTPVSATIADADSLLSGFAGLLPYSIKSSSATGLLMISDALVLESYNEAALTPDCVG